MGINKNINVNASNCRSCDHIATMTVSPTLLTDKEIKYEIHGHGFSAGGDSSCECGDVDEKIRKAVEDALSSANTYTNRKVDDVSTRVERLYEEVEYEIVHAPEGTLVDYRDKEIRVMCPADTKWVFQQSGEGANRNMYYIGLKAYAPSEDVVSFKEDLADSISDDTMYYFEGNEFAGVDADGRKYSVVWLPVAIYDEATSSWTYYGVNSSDEKYIGWHYSVEWYNKNGVLVKSDCIRINLSNEDCHTSIEPSYTITVVGEAVETAKTYTDEQIQKIVESVEDITDEDIENLFN